MRVCDLMCQVEQEAYAVFIQIKMQSLYGIVTHVANDQRRCDNVTVCITFVFP